MVHGAGLLYTTLLSSSIFTGLLVHMVHGAGFLYTALLSFPISLQGYWSIWFMGKVCYILRYCLFLYLYRVTGLYGSWDRFAIYYATVFSYIFTGLLVCMVHGAGLIYTALLSFPISFQVTGLYGSWGRFSIYCDTVFSISLQDNWSIWFMRQVCYILRYCLFLYLYRVTGLYGSWGRFAIYCATVFSYIFTG